MKKLFYQHPVMETVAVEEQGFLAQSPKANTLPGLEYQDPVMW